MQQRKKKTTWHTYRVGPGLGVRRGLGKGGSQEEGEITDKGGGKAQEISFMASL